MKPRKGGKGGDKGRELVVRGDGQAYARVVKMLGNGRLLAACEDGVERLGIIRGSMRKREWVRVGDTVLVTPRDFQDAKVDVVCVYTDAEVHRLKRLGEDVAFKPADAEEEEHVVEFEADPVEDEGDAEFPWEDI